MSVLTVPGAPAASPPVLSPVFSPVLSPVFAPEEITARARQIRRPVHVVSAPDGRELGIATGPVPDGPVLGTLPPLYPEWLGGRTFCEAHGVRFPYVAGEMANGIATTRMVSAMARAEMLGFFGAGGWPIPMWNGPCTPSLGSWTPAATGVSTSSTHRPNRNWSSVWPSCW